MKKIILITCILFTLDISAKNRGLHNETGSDCFMNASMQALSHIQDLKDFGNQYKGNNFLGIQPLQTFFTFLEWLQEAPLNVPLHGSAEFRSYWTNSSNFLYSYISYPTNLSKLSSGHQDTQEFLSAILDILYQCFEHFKTLLNTDSINPLDSIRFESITKIQGNRCKHSSIKRDLNSLLSLPIPDQTNIVPINHCLNDFSKAELLTGNEKWLCEPCNNKVDATRKTTISTLPVYLIIQLKRFGWDEEKKESKKKDTPISFPLQLTLNKSSSILDEDLKNKLGSFTIKFDLFAIICHAGSLKGGHYWAYGKDEKGDWYKYNDSEVSPKLSPTELNNILNQQSEKSKPYILFYKLDETNKQQLSQHGLLLSLPEPYEPIQPPTLPTVAIQPQPLPQISQAPQELDTLKQKLTNLKTSLQTLRQRLVTLQQKLTQLKDKLEALKTS